MTTILTASELFIPAPSGVGPFGNVPLVPPLGTWLGRMLDVATTTQLPTTSWQSGAPERTIFAIEAVSFSLSDANISVMAQGGFLQTAASGSVTYTTLDGTTVTIPVTPDPSNAAQNPTGAPGWLDLILQDVYGVTRLQAAAATGPLAIVNVKAGSVGPYTAGQYHVANVVNGATYNNPSTLTIPSSQIAGTGGTVTGVSVGLASTIITTQSAHGLSAGQTVYLSVPGSAGVSGLAGVFALVASVTSTTFQVSIGSSGTFSGTVANGVYLCTVATMQADVAGLIGNAAVGTVTTAITQNAGVFISNVVSWSGSNWESNVAAMNRAVLSLASRSPNGPSQAYVYFAETAQQILAAASPPVILSNGAVQASESANPQTGIVTTVVASATPASTTLGQAVTPGCAQLPISSISAANPAVVTCSGPHNLIDPGPSVVTISGVLGSFTVCNGLFQATWVSATEFSIPIDTSALGAHPSSGQVEGGDLGQIDLLLQENVVPDGITAVTVSALAFPIAIVATVVVPQAQVAAYSLAVLAQLQTQLSSYPVGGLASPNNYVRYDDIIGALEEAGVVTLGAPSYVVNIQALTINGGTTDLAFPSNQYQALLPAPIITVVGI